jgi:hypothetical protein
MLRWTLRYSNAFSTPEFKNQNMAASSEKMQFVNLDKIYRINRIFLD